MPHRQHWVLKALLSSEAAEMLSIPKLIILLFRLERRDKVEDPYQGFQGEACRARETPWCMLLSGIT